LSSPPRRGRRSSTQPATWRTARTRELSGVGKRKDFPHLHQRIKCIAAQQDNPLDSWKTLEK